MDVAENDSKSLLRREILYSVMHFLMLKVQVHVQGIYTILCIQLKEFVVFFVPTFNSQKRLFGLHSSSILGVSNN